MERLSTERVFELKAYGQFLQCIPVPGKFATFITLQGQPKLYNEAERDEEAEYEKEKRQQNSSSSESDSDGKRNRDLLLKKTIQVIEDKPKICKQEFQMLDKFSSTEEDSAHDFSKRQSEVVHNQAIAKQLSKILNSKEEQYMNEMSLNEVETCYLRRNQPKDENKALLSYWRFKEDTKEFDCVESFKITQPIPFKDMNYLSGKKNQKLFLYRSQSNEIFWFTEKDDETI